MLDGSTTSAGRVPAITPVFALTLKAQHIRQRPQGLDKKSSSSPVEATGLLQRRSVHFLTAPAVSPFTNIRIAKRNKTIKGIELMA